MALVYGFLHLLIIFRLQRRTARVILNADSRANSVDLKLRLISALVYKRLSRLYVRITQTKHRHRFY